MSPDWLHQFRQAATVAQPELLQALIEKVLPDQSHLAIALKQMVDHFQFELIIQCTASLQSI